MIQRRADGTYREKGLLLLDALKPPVYYESTGNWQFQAGRYSETVRTWTEPTFKRSVGKTVRFSVLQVDAQRFRYLSTDNAEVEQRRIGDASDATFERGSADPFPPYGGLSPEIVHKVRKALPVTP